MSIEQFKIDMIESINKRVASGVRLMSRSSAASRNGICAECAITMLFHEKISSDLSFDEKELSFEKNFELVQRKYSVLLSLFVDGFDSDTPNKRFSGLGDEMYNFGKEIRDEFHPVKYKELFGDEH